MMMLFTLLLGYLRLESINLCGLSCHFVIDDQAFDQLSFVLIRQSIKRSRFHILSFSLEQ